MWAIDYLSAHSVHLLPNLAIESGTSLKKKKGENSRQEARWSHRHAV
jgi:hypothetical protein